MSYERKLITFSLIIISFFFLWDLGNLDGLRQGTEGFYLQISKEMFEESSFMTPLYLGNPHWSKPPFHFWLPQGLFFFNGGATLFLARFSITIVSIFSIFLMSSWIHRHFSIPRSHSLIFIAASLGFIKYSRIYMMEIPLSCLTALSSLYFYDYLISNKKVDLLKAALFLSFGTLVKGPVALVMATGGIGLFSIFNYLQTKQLNIKKISLWIILSTALSSIWFILSYVRHGQEFIDYFFLRENLGKFTAKSYPIKVVFQGLLIFSLPWSLFLLNFFKDLKSKSSSFLNDQKLIPYLFLITHFIFFFVLWIIPSQRSHHYAIPALPFFLSLILVSCFSDEQKHKKTFRLISALSIVLAIFTLFTLSFQQVHGSIKNLIAVSLTAVSFLLCAYFCYKDSTKYFKKFLTIFSSLTALWVFLIPSFYLPFVPTKIRSISQKNDVLVSVRKPYFVEEAIQKKVRALDPSRVATELQKNSSGSIFLVHRYDYERFGWSKYATILEKWPIWQRGRNIKHIFEALKKSDLTILQEDMLLLRPQNID